MTRKFAERLSMMTIMRSTNKQKHRRLSGIPIRNFVYHYADTLMNVSKKSWYVGFAMGFVFAMLMGTVMFYSLK